MKRKVSIFTLLLSCIFILTACGQAQDPDEAAREAAKQEQYRQMGAENGKQLLSELSQVVDEGMTEQLLGQSDELDKLLNSFESGMADVGSIDKMDEPEVEVDGRQIIVDIPITGTLLDPNGNPRQAQVEMIFDTKGESMYPDLAVNPKYTSGELMTKAGLNTLLGMGVTFAILILISLIISSFTLIGKVQNKPKKEESPAAVSVDNAVRQIEAGEEQAASEDDAELVAVIAAAIAAYEAEAGGTYESADGVVIRSIRRVNRAKWQNA